jgi:hypothetical protein
LLPWIANQAYWRFIDAIIITYWPRMLSFNAIFGHWSNCNLSIRLSQMHRAY